MRLFYLYIPQTHNETEFNETDINELHRNIHRELWMNIYVYMEKMKREKF